MFYGILMRVVYCQNSLRGVMTQVWILQCLYCYFFQIKRKKSSYYLMSTFKHYRKESGNILCAGERNNSTAGQEWSQRGDGKDI